MPYQKEIILYKLKELLHEYGDVNIKSITPVKADASERKLFRITAGKGTYIGVYNENIPENNAFIGFSKSFRKAGLNVPEIYACDNSRQIYIEEDLGDTTLFSFSKKNVPRKEIISKYKEALSWLLRFQIEAAGAPDYSLCYQTNSFNSGMLDDDFIKFKDYYGTKVFVNNENSHLLENTAEIIGSKILQDKYEYFMYRDFQPRNIMIKPGEPGDELYFIDYQSGRKGPLQYDPASFLYSGSIDIGDEERRILLKHYTDGLQSKYGIDKAEFTNKFYYYVLARLIQVLGSYSYLFTLRKDPLLLAKIPKALENMRSISEKFEEKEIRKLVNKITES